MTLNSFSTHLRQNCTLNAQKKRLLLLSFNEINNKDIDIWFVSLIKYTTEIDFFVFILSFLVYKNSI